MPRGNGTGPTGQGAGTGRGNGGTGRGRMGGNRPGSGPGGNCICPSCGTESFHQRSEPCSSMTCSKCGSQMIKK